MELHAPTKEGTECTSLQLELERVLGCGVGGEGHKVFWGIINHGVQNQGVVVEGSHLNISSAYNSSSFQGLSSPVFKKLEAELAKALLSAPASKAFEVGSGFAGKCAVPIKVLTPIYRGRLVHLQFD